MYKSYDKQKKNTKRKLINLAVLEVRPKQTGPNWKIYKNILGPFETFNKFTFTFRKMSVGVACSLVLYKIIWQVSLVNKPTEGYS